jgi:opacity protein-like surface antigen
MKKLLFIFATVLCFAAAQAQQLKAEAVPERAKLALQKTFGVATAQWSKQGEFYLANFAKDGQNLGAVFSSFGDMVEKQEKVAASSLPAAASQYLQQQYPKLTISSATKITATNGGVVSYRVTVKKQTLVFDAAGQLKK